MFQEGLLKDKVVLVTGGGTGLGRSMCERFLALGAKVAISSRRQEVLDRAAQEMMDSSGGEVFTTTVDVRDPEQVSAMMDAVEGHFGRIDVLLNNAAGNFISPTERLSHRAVDAVLNIVLHGTFYCTLDLGKRWIEKQQKGVVLNIATTYAMTGSGYVAPSAAAKAGVVSLTKSLAAEWGKYGIRLNAIAPGALPHRRRVEPPHAHRRDSRVVRKAHPARARRQARRTRQPRLIPHLGYVGLYYWRPHSY